MSQLGRPVEEMREKLAKERHEEYNKYLQDVSTAPGRSPPDNRVCHTVATQRMGCIIRSLKEAYSSHIGIGVYLT